MFRALKNNWREIGRPVGFWAFIYHLLSRVVQVLSRGRCRFVIYRLYIQPLVESGATLRTGYTVEEIRAGDPREALGDRPVHILSARRESGYRCFALNFKGEDIGLAWFATKGRYEEDEFRIDFEMSPIETLVWDFDVFIIEKWRVGRAFSQLWTGVSNSLRHEGFTHTASRIHLNNINSILSHERLGAFVTARVVILSVVNLQLSLQMKPLRLAICRSNQRARTKVCVRSV